jgi:KEOPS complex subunit Pcc1
MRVHEGIFQVEHEHARHLLEALKPEEHAEAGSRTTTRVWLEGDTTLILQVQASDISALRAALNMWLRLINVAYEMQELVYHG